MTKGENLSDVVRQKYPKNLFYSAGFHVLRSFLNTLKVLYGRLDFVKKYKLDIPSHA